MIELASGCRAFEYSKVKDNIIARGVLVDLEKIKLDLLISNDLLNRSFNRLSGSYLDPMVRSGISLPECLIKDATSTQLSEPLLFACNALHTNFVRGNGFIFRYGRLYCKPAGAVGLDGESFQPLDGKYTALVLDPPPIQINHMIFENGKFCAAESPQMAISGPAVVQDGKNIARNIPFRPGHLGQTLRDEINFPPDDPAGRSSFTVIGYTLDALLQIVSVFSGKGEDCASPLPIRTFQTVPNTGLTLVEVADIMIDLGLHNAILGGGSADTQQYIYGSEIWVSSARSQSIRSQARVSGPFGNLRGLGVILTIRSPEQRNCQSIV